MKNKEINNMMLAFILNFTFVIIEIIGAIATNSIAIITDAIHDLGDCLSIWIAIVLKKISYKKPDSKYTYGYARYSIIGGLINLVVLSVGATIIVYNAIPRLLNPQEVNYTGMFVLAILGIVFNFIGAYKTRNSKDVSEKIISLHLLEDLFGWLLVLISSIAIGIFKLYIIDPILSLLLALFIFVNVVKNLKEILDIILEKTPNNVDIESITKQVENLDDVKNIHHIHIWSLDGKLNCLTAHVCTYENTTLDKIELLKKSIKHILEHNNISHSTLEIEINSCEDEICNPQISVDTHSHHSH